MADFNQGIAVDAWVHIADDCAMQGEIVGGQAQFEFGHSAGCLHLIVEPDSMAALAEVVNKAAAELEEMR